MATMTFSQLPFTGQLHEGACKNHPHMRYLTKGPGRGLHFCPAPEHMFNADGTPVKECDCPLADIEFFD